MECENLVKMLECEFEKSNEVFFEYLWREKIESGMLENNKYLKLIEWMNEKIEASKEIVNIFNPADKTNDYSMGFFQNYKQACEDLAILLNLKGIMLDNRCTAKMMENIEYAICKNFNINYNDTLDKYQ